MNIFGNLGFDFALIIKRLIMETLHKLIFLTTCLLLFAGCKEKEEVHGGCGGCIIFPYTDIVKSITDSYSLENKNFRGKGLFEIMDTLFTDYPTIYCPPQKIEFEFKY
jgi:hypothetical protein